MYTRVESGTEQDHVAAILGSIPQNLRVGLYPLASIIRTLVTHSKNGLIASDQFRLPLRVTDYNASGLWQPRQTNPPLSALAIITHEKIFYPRLSGDFSNCIYRMFDGRKNTSAAITEAFLMLEGYRSGQEIVPIVESRPDYSGDKPIVGVRECRQDKFTIPARGILGAYLIFVLERQALFDRDATAN